MGVEKRCSNELLKLKVEKKLNIHYGKSKSKSIDTKVELKDFDLTSKYIELKGSVIQVNFIFFKEVKNVYRYKLQKTESEIKVIRFCNNKNSFTSNFNDLKEDEDKDKDTIVLILESPHMDEFSYSKSIHPLAPAQGKTGQNIEKYIENIIDENKDISEKIDIDKEYRLLLVNPVPIQTSLHYFHRQSISSSFATLRNNVWKVFWENKKVYKTRLKNIVKTNRTKIILNCCTSALSPLVDAFIKEHKHTGASLFILNHPSVWNFKAKRMIKKE